MARIAIIGGGYAGMAAAVTLAERGVGVTVFEAGKTLGGRARRIDYRGSVIDNGQHILAGAYSELLRLMAVVGVAKSALKRVPLTLSMPPEFRLAARPSAWLPGPLYLAWMLLCARGLTIADKFAAVRFMQALKRAKFQVDSTKTVATLLREHRQPQNLIDSLWRPLTISALNTPVETASAQVLANVLRDSLLSTREASDLLLPMVDLSALFPAPAAAWLGGHGGEVQLATRVKSITAISANDGGYQVETDAALASFDAVIIAVGPHQLAGLMPQIDAPALAFEPIVTVYFKFDQAVRLPEAMFGQASGLAQWFFDRDALGGRGGNEGMVAAVISASGVHEDLHHERLAAGVLQELTRHLPHCPPPLWQKVIVEKFATFACTPNAPRPATTTSYAGVFLAGDYVAGDYPATLEGAARNGIKAAHACLGHLQQCGNVHL